MFRALRILFALCLGLALGFAAAAPVAAHADDAPVLTWSTTPASLPPELSFGDVTVGQASSPQIITLTNTGTAAATVDAITVAPTNMPFFVWSQDGTSCSLGGAFVLAEGSSCNLAVSFVPTDDGDATATLAAHETLGSEASASISGHGNGEQVQNGGFNTYSVRPRIPDGWTPMHFGPRDGKDARVGHNEEGTASLRITGRPGRIKTISQYIDLNGSTLNQFALSFWVRGHDLPAAGICRVRVWFYNAGPEPFLKKTLPCGRTGTFAFRQRLLPPVTFANPGAFTGARIVILYSKPGGTVWFDLVSLKGAVRWQN